MEWKKSGMEWGGVVTSTQRLSVGPSGPLGGYMFIDHRVSIASRRERSTHENLTAWISSVMPFKSGLQMKK